MSGLVKLKLPAGGSKTLSAPDSASDEVITLPAGTGGTLVQTDASGNVGIGTSSPQAVCHIKQSVDATPALQIQHGDGDFVVFEEGGGTDLWKITRPSGTNNLEINNINAASTILKTSNTNRLEITSDGRGLSQFTAKAWVNFRGTSTVLIRDSHNCSSIVDTGTGSYTVNFTNTMASDNYCGVATIDSHQDQAGGTTIGGGVRYSAPTYIRVFSRNRNGTDMYDQDMSVLVFGD